MEKAGKMMEYPRSLNVVVDSENSIPCLRDSKRNRFMHYLDILGIDNEGLFSC